MPKENLGLHVSQIHLQFLYFDKEFTHMQEENLMHRHLTGTTNFSSMTSFLMKYASWEHFPTDFALLPPTPVKKTR